MPTTRASSRMWIPGIEEIASKMRPRTPVPPAAKPSLPEESGHVDQEEDRNLEARHRILHRHRFATSCRASSLPAFNEVDGDGGQRGRAHEPTEERGPVGRSGRKA